MGLIMIMSPCIEQVPRQQLLKKFFSFSRINLIFTVHTMITISHRNPLLWRLRDNPLTKDKWNTYPPLYKLSPSVRQLFLHPLKIAAAQCEKNEPLPFIYNSTVCCIPRGKSAVSSVCNIPLRSPLFSVLSGICEDSEYLLSYPRCGCHDPPVSDGWFQLSATGTVHKVCLLYTSDAADEL